MKFLPNRIDIGLPRGFLICLSALGAFSYVSISFRTLSTTGTLIGVLVSLVVVAIVARFLSYASVAVLLGATLPWYTIRELPPVTFDLIRLLLVIALLCHSQRRINIPAICLGVSVFAGLYALLGIVLSDAGSIHFSLSILLGVVIALACSPKISSQVLTGYVVGCAISGLAVLSQAFLGVRVGADLQGSITYVGLSSTSTALGPEIALALYLLVRQRHMYRRMISIALLVILSVSILVCGSRAGLVAALVGLLIWLFESRVNWRIKLSALIFSASALAVGRLLSWPTISRSVGSTALPENQILAVDYSTGRVEGIRAGLNLLYWRDLLGVGVTQADARSVHTLFLWLPASFGIVGWVSLFGFFGLFFFAGLPIAVLGMIAAVGIAEPVGLLAGGSTLPILILLTQQSRSRWPFKHSESPPDRRINSGSRTYGKWKFRL